MPTYLPWLDLLRFLACVLVIVSHIDPERHLGHIGHAGVGLFFSISGFLIGSVLLNARGQSAWLPRFYANRFLRIYPPLLMALVVVGACFYFGLSREAKWEDFYKNLPHYLTFTVHLSPNQGVPYGITWTLCVEEYFYLVLPIFLWLLRPRLTAIVLGLVIAVTCLPQLEYLPGDKIGTWFLIPVNLLAGAILATLRPQQHDGRPWVGIFGLGLFFLNTWTNKFHPFGPIMGILTTAIVWSFATTRVPIPGSLELPVKAGKWSYGIYLLHLLFCRAALRLCDTLRVSEAGYEVRFVVSVLIATVGASLAAGVMYTLAERPILSRRKWVNERPWARTLAMIAQVSLVPVGLLYCLLVYGWNW